MKLQIVLVLAIVACAFADEVPKDPELDAVDEVKVEAEAKDDDKVQVEKDSAEKSEVETIKEKPESEENVSDDDQKDELEGIKGPIIFEWSSVYRTHDIDAAVPVEINWPSNLMDFINALHSDGLQIVPQNPDFGPINLAFPPQFNLRK